MNWKIKKNQRLIKAVLTLKTEAEVRRFLRDLMTEKEIKEFSNRFKAAEMLTEQAPYFEIIKQTGLSSATVARVSKWLNGKEGGYRIVIAKLHHRPIQSRSGLF